MPESDTTEILAEENASADLTEALGAASAAGRYCASLTRPGHLAVGQDDPADAASPWRIVLDDPEGGWAGTVAGSFPTESAARSPPTQSRHRLRTPARSSSSTCCSDPSSPVTPCSRPARDGGCCHAATRIRTRSASHIVAPGWTAPLNSDMRLRDVRRSDGPGADTVPPARQVLLGRQRRLRRRPVRSGGRPHRRRARRARRRPAMQRVHCAVEIDDRYAAAFREWFDAHAVIHLPANVIASRAAPRCSSERRRCPTSTCAGVIDADVRAARSTRSSSTTSWSRRATRVPVRTVRGRLVRWLAADAAIDWHAERLQETVTEILPMLSWMHDGRRSRDALQLRRDDPGPLRQRIPRLDARQHRRRSRHPATSPRSSRRRSRHARVSRSTRRRSTPCGSCSPRGTAAYVEASYRLQVLVDALADLRNTYPRATLHDCDEGSDFNPVRLGQTALGSN